MSILIGVMFVFAIGVLMLSIARRSMNRLSAVAVLPVLLLAFSAAPSDASEECVTDTTEVLAEESTTTVAPTTTVPPTTTTVPPTTTTVPPTTTTTAPRISLSITSAGTIASVSVDDGIPTSLSSNSWVGTASAASTTFSVTGDFNTVSSVTGATCGSLVAVTPTSSSVTCTITANAVVLELNLIT